MRIFKSFHIWFSRFDFPLAPTQAFHPMHASPMSNPSSLPALSLLPGKSLPPFPPLLKSNSSFKVWLKTQLLPKAAPGHSCPQLSLPPSFLCWWHSSGHGGLPVWGAGQCLPAHRPLPPSPWTRGQGWDLLHPPEWHSTVSSCHRDLELDRLGFQSQPITFPLFAGP